jgi:hypothetical protein
MNRGIIGDRRVGKRRRIALLVLAALLSGIVPMLAPGTAAATSSGAFGPEIPCPTDPNIIWRRITLSRNVLGWEGIHYNVLSATSFFAVSDSRFVDNGLDVPIQATFTSQQSATVTITVTIGTAAQLADKLQRTVSFAIQISRTTSIGVSATVTVPPHSRITGEYGTEAYNVSYTGQVVWKRNDGSLCWDRGTRSGATAAPTSNEGWRFR